ncbi:hypothetical protein Taro_028323, partial [Colocasia esculenta]|nr:hypothetical protein [Colocasia esculenta]
MQLMILLGFVGATYLPHLDHHQKAVIYLSLLLTGVDKHSHGFGAYSRSSCCQFLLGPTMGKGRRIKRETDDLSCLVVPELNPSELGLASFNTVAEPRGAVKLIGSNAVVW